MSTPAEKPRSGEWLEDWDPQDESKWDSRIAWTTLTITTFSLTMAFVSWFLPSAIIPKLTSIGFAFSKAAFKTGFELNLRNSSDVAFELHP